MRNDSPRCSAILFGASGNIGGVLLQHMKQAGWSVLGTYAEHPNEGLIHCDLTQRDPARDMDFRQYRFGIILSGVSSIDQCKQDPAAAARINVEGVKRLIDTLVKNDVRPVFFSTDYVYDGAKGNYSETDRPCPNTEYGQQKAEMETCIQEDFPEALIVRISKVFSVDPSDNTLLSQWHRMIRRNETIRNIVDQRTCPTWNGDLNSGLLQLLERDASGLFNLCQPRSYTRGELLREFLDALGIQYGNIVETEASQFGFLDERPTDISLNPSKFLQFTGFEFTPMQVVFERFQRNLEER